VAPKYVIISPVRNEKKYLAGTITSVAAQTVLPTQWIIVDDGSTDGSSALLHGAARKHPWITVTSRADRGARKPGTGVVEAFYDGYTFVRQSWDFLVKLDGDVSFASDYFERCLQKFAANPKLGIGGGTVCNWRNGTLVPESSIDPAFHVRGATKIYRRECWDQIGELIRAPGWDTLDELKANMLGWTTVTFPDIQIVHHKPAGSADGLANYIVGYHPLFMLLKAARRSVHRPYALGALGLLTGFVTGYAKRVPQIPDKDLIRYLRRQQLRKLTFQSSLWRF
jgi:glycosyltransferase involved in cell wall biosynthesis